MSNQKTDSKTATGLKFQPANKTEAEASDKPAASKPESKQAPEVKVSIDAKIQRVADLNDLIAKWGQLLNAQRKLNSFDLKREEASTSIELSDNEGNSFFTSTPTAIQRFISDTKLQIQSELALVEAKITI